MGKGQGFDSCADWEAGIYAFTSSPFSQSLLSRVVVSVQARGVYSGSIIDRFDYMHFPSAEYLELSSRRTSKKSVPYIKPHGDHATLLPNRPLSPHTLTIPLFFKLHLLTHNSPYSPPPPHSLHPAPPPPWALDFPKNPQAQ